MVRAKSANEVLRAGSSIAVTVNAQSSDPQSPGVKPVVLSSASTASTATTSAPVVSTTMAVSTEVPLLTPRTTRKATDTSLIFSDPIMDTLPAHRMASGPDSNRMGQWHTQQERAADNGDSPPPPPVAPRPSKMLLADSATNSDDIRAPPKLSDMIFSPSVYEIPVVLYESIAIGDADTAAHAPSASNGQKSDGEPVRSSQPAFEDVYDTVPSARGPPSVHPTISSLPSRSDILGCSLLGVISELPTYSSGPPLPPRDDIAPDGSQTKSSAARAEEHLYDELLSRTSSVCATSPEALMSSSPCRETTRLPLPGAVFTPSQTPQSNPSIQEASQTDSNHLGGRRERLSAPWGSAAARESVNRDWRGVSFTSGFAPQLITPGAFAAAILRSRSTCGDSDATSTCTSGAGEQSAPADHRRSLTSFPAPAAATHTRTVSESEVETYEQLQQPSMSAATSLPATNNVASLPAVLRKSTKLLSALQPAPAGAGSTPSSPAAAASLPHTAHASELSPPSTSSAHGNLSPSGPSASRNLTVHQRLREFGLAVAPTPSPSPAAQQAVFPVTTLAAACVALGMGPPHARRPDACESSTDPLYEQLLSREGSSVHLKIENTTTEGDA
jgi:hypothetical protein